MQRKRAIVTIVGFSVLLVVTLLWIAVSYYGSLTRCITQHQEALGRQIVMQILEATTNGMAIVPATSEYSVHDIWPMHYELHLRAGYQFPTDSTKRANSEAVIAYFIAHPTYPIWARVTGLTPLSSELLILRENLAVQCESRDRLLENIKDW